MRARGAASSGSASINPALILATSGALLTLVPVAAYQLGLLEYLPDPPGKIFASDEITGSSMAHPLGIPDSLPGIVSYGATLSLAIVASHHPEARRGLALKLIADGSVAAFNMVRQVVKFRKLCSWCTATAICTAAMVFAGRKLIAGELPEVRNLT